MGGEEKKMLYYRQPVAFHETFIGPEGLAPPKVELRPYLRHNFGGNPSRVDGPTGLFYVHLGSGTYSEHYADGGRALKEATAAVSVVNAWDRKPTVRLRMPDKLADTPDVNMMGAFHCFTERLGLPDWDLTERAPGVHEVDLVAKRHMELQAFNREGQELEVCVAPASLVAAGLRLVVASSLLEQADMPLQPHPEDIA